MHVFASTTIVGSGRGQHHGQEATKKAKKKKSAKKAAKATKKQVAKKKVGRAKKKPVAKAKMTMGAALAVDKEAKARVLTLQALGFGPLPDTKTLASLLINNAPSKAGLAGRLRALGVNINDAPVILCKTVGDVVKAVKARIRGRPWSIYE